MQVRTLDYTREEYLALDAAAPEGRRWEYDGAGVWLLAGAGPEHNDLAANTARALGNRLVPRGCRVRQSDQRVQLASKYVYPDVVAFCEEGRYTDENPPSLLNPGLIVEVLSSSTMEKDRSWKLDAYFAVPSVQECWLAFTDQIRLDQYVRDGDGWRLLSLVEEGAVLHSDAFGLEIPLKELYELVFLSRQRSAATKKETG